MIKLYPPKRPQNLKSGEAYILVRVDSNLSTPLAIRSFPERKAGNDIAQRFNKRRTPDDYYPRYHCLQRASCWIAEPPIGPAYLCWD